MDFDTVAWKLSGEEKGIEFWDIISSTQWVGPRSTEKFTSRLIQFVTQYLDIVHSNKLQNVID